MSSLVGLGCCPCCKVTTCLSGDTIDTGCCLACDDLIMWSERPAFSITQKYFLPAVKSCLSTCPGHENDLPVYPCNCAKTAQQCSEECLTEVPCHLIDFTSSGDDGWPYETCGENGKIVHQTTSAEELEPLQTVYQFYKTYWRPIDFYSGGYPVHNGSYNTHRRALISQLPILTDPINGGEYLSPGLSRCKYETLQDNPKMYHWQAGGPRATMRSCLSGESPCAKSCTGSQGLPCTAEEHLLDISGGGSFCGGFILTPNDIIDDLKRGYYYSHLENTGTNCCYPLCDNAECTAVSNPPLCECDSYWMTTYRRRKLLDNYRHIWGTDIECYNDSKFASHTNGGGAYNSQAQARNYIQKYDASLGPQIQSTFQSFSSPTAFRLSDHWLFNMTFERWWKIGQSTEDGLTQSFWNIPGQSGANPNPTYPPTNPPYPYQVDDLVPKWWIHACSAVPFFQFEMEDALNPMNKQSSTPRTAAIDQSQYDDFDDYRNTQPLLPFAEYRLQSLFESLGTAGYFESKDWRLEQIQIYQELNNRFPNAGYAPYAASSIDDMSLLGPFRKRYYADHNTAKSFSMKTPYLRPDLVPKSALGLQAECFIPYPGEFANRQTMTLEQQAKAIDDYYFWAERQWVYFRGAPLGWTWANWNSGATCPCCEGGFPGLTNEEDEAILAGCGRAAGNCIESWFNSPQVVTVKNIETDNVCYEAVDINGACTACLLACALSAVCTSGSDSDNKLCDACNHACQMSDVCRLERDVPQCFSTTDFCGCAPRTFLGCPTEDCSKASINAYCGGVHIIAVQYATENKSENAIYTCGETVTKEPIDSKYRCLWAANTFLTSAKNVYEFNNISHTCKSASNTTMRNYWPDIKNSHIVPQKSICNNHLAAITNDCPNANQRQYKIVPACESGICSPWYYTATCCGGVDEGCQENPESGEFNLMECTSRMPCVSLQHGKQWDGRFVCPPSCGTDTPSYGYNYYNLYKGYKGQDGNGGGPTESSCERDSFIGYEPECTFAPKRSV